MNFSRSRLFRIQLGLSFLLALMTTGANHPTAEASITAAELETHMRFMADDRLKGRDSGSEGLKQAAAYLRAAFTDYGLTPFGDEIAERPSFFQKVTMAGDPRLAKSGNRLEASGREWIVEKEFMPFSFSGNGELKGKKVVFVGYGITDHEDDYDDYAAVNVKDKIVVMLRYEHEESSNENYKPTPHAFLVNKARNAKEHGAAGVIIVNGPLCRKAGREDPLFGLQSAGGINRKIPVVHAKRTFLETLLGDGWPSLKTLQTRLDREKETLSFEIPDQRVTLSVRLEKDEIEAENVVALLEGDDPELKQEYVVIGAHYDHVGLGYYGGRWGPRGAGQIHNGADDNASGTVAVLEIAQAFASMKIRPKRSLVFILFCGEERGLLGSKYFVDHPPVPLSRIVAMLNADMIGRSDKSRLTLSGVGSATGFRDLADKLNEDLDLDIVFNESGLGPSDHASFYRKDIPVLFYFTGIHQQYHTPNDDMHLINYADQARIGKHIFRMAASLADSTQRPVFRKKEGSGGVRLGIYPNESGTRLGIEDVVPDSPADVAGLLPGDIILELNGTAVKSLSDLLRLTGKIQSGAKGKIKILRRRDKEETEREYLLQF